MLFISYSHKDAAFVDRLSTRLIEQNVKVWKDKWKIGVSDSFVEKIKAGIKGASYFCIVLSNNSLGSKWVKEEINLALVKESSERGIKILPLRLDDCEIPSALSDRIYVDFKTDFDSGFKQILTLVEDKYNIGDTGRSGLDSEYFFDYGIEQAIVDGRYFMQLDVVSYDKEETFVILSQFKFFGNELARHEHLGLEAGESIRNFILKACAEEFAVRPARVTVKRIDATKGRFEIQDTEGVPCFEVEVRIKLLGNTSRETVLFNVGALFAQICEVCGIDLNLGDT